VDVRENVRQGRKRLAIGLAASLVVHAALVLWFLVRPPIEPLRVPRPYRVELFEVPREKPVPAPPPSEQAGVEAAPEASPDGVPPLNPSFSRRGRDERGTEAPRVVPRARGRSEREPGEREPVVREPAEREPVKRAPAQPGGGRPPSTDEVEEWFADRGLGAEGQGEGEGSARGDNLSAPVPGDVKRAIEDGPPGSGNARERAGRISSELHASDVTRYPDRRWTVLRDRIGRGFAPSPQSLGAAATDGAMGSFFRSYGGYASEYAKKGSPYGDAPDAVGRANSTIASASEATDGTTRGPDASAGGVEQRMAAASGYTPREVIANGRAAVVAMEQDARGVVIGVWLVRSSGSSEYDVTAMKQLENLRGQAVPAPWGAAITEWAFRTEVAITPFRPGLGGTFDVGSEGIKLERPLDPRIRTHPPELVAIRPVRDGKAGPG
jgi:hypothetical protein